MIIDKKTLTRTKLCSTVSVIRVVEPEKWCSKSIKVKTAFLILKEESYLILKKISFESEDLLCLLNSGNLYQPTY